MVNENNTTEVFPLEDMRKLNSLCKPKKIII